MALARCAHFARAVSIELLGLAVARFKFALGNEIDPFNACSLLGLPLVASQGQLQERGQLRIDRSRAHLMCKLKC